MSQVRYEQAVYGSFPFWDRGYDLLAHSSGCRPEWLDGFRTACQRFGEPPWAGADADAAGALFALRLPCGPWLVVGVCPQGADDRGRPGALAFHGLFLSPRAYRRAGLDPFALAGAICRDWGPQTARLPAGSVAVGPPGTPPDLGPEFEPTCRWIVEALQRGRRVALESPEPIDALARAVWARLPARVRRRASVATLAFANANRFDLVALPRLAGIELDRSYVTPGTSVPSRPRWAGVVTHAPRAASYAAAAGLLVVGASWLALRDRGDSNAEGPPAEGLAALGASSPVEQVSPHDPIDRSYPARAAFRDDLTMTETEKARVSAGLNDLAARFGVVDALQQDNFPADPATTMAVLAERLRYRGPTLSPAELDRLAHEPGGVRARAWHEHLRHFAPGRPVPPDFAEGPLRWQLAVLAWSFRVELPPRLPPAEVPFALADALAVPWPVRTSPLADRYPTLAEYARFLERLPRR